MAGQNARSLADRWSAGEVSPYGTCPGGQRASKETRGVNRLPVGPTVHPSEAHSERKRTLPESTWGGWVVWDNDTATTCGACGFIRKLADFEPVDTYTPENEKAWEKKIARGDYDFRCPPPGDPIKDETEIKRMTDELRRARAEQRIRGSRRFAGSALAALPKRRIYPPIRILPIDPGIGVNGVKIYDRF